MYMYCWDIWPFLIGTAIGTAFHLGNLPRLLTLPSLKWDGVLALPLVFIASGDGPTDLAGARRSGDRGRVLPECGGCGGEGYDAIVPDRSHGLGGPARSGVSAKDDAGLESSTTPTDSGDCQR